MKIPPRAVLSFSERCEMAAKAKPQVPASLQGLEVPVTDLVPYGKNPRKGCSAAIGVVATT